MALAQRISHERLRRGVPLPEVSRMLGHVRVSVTADHYLRWLPSGQAEAAKILSDSLPPGLAGGHLQHVLQ